MSRELYIGLMSGTSADGLDVALVAIDEQSIEGNHIELLGTLEAPLPSHTKKLVSELALSGPDEINKLAQLDIQLAESFAQASLKLLEQQGLKPEDIAAIGSHGQTIRHIPKSDTQAGYTLQIGDPARIAEATQICTIADFRRRDIAAGGQGAPLAPAFHKTVFQHPTCNRFAVNIGGMANISYIPATQLQEDVIGFDTGPGNALMDAWIMLHKGKPYDLDGLWALSGTVSDHLLTRLLKHPFLEQSAPKSTGREAFNMPWLEQQLSGLSLNPEDVQATLMEFTARSIAMHVLQLQLAGELYVCGGGAHNGALMQRLDELLEQFTVADTSSLGVHPDWVEAVTFAWLAHQCKHNKSGNLPSVTGAKGNRILGAIYPA
ncbi:anhydro-N-acetylmuramic acid kinase [uncultured Pseudoteredinibacter sp.]|uniref:anhydro-N-acetylmuramic acid kinase n=1 Tax=uncultured Pseudoteredinibacter sp. TaxID=1641701 RepID=UPI0026021911|nr:anhydro-N-acetylmuramic acid kinase [uncultured Pseudoteredinibacter sp.]